MPTPKPFGAATVAGTGDWRGTDEITGIGDVDGDLVARIAGTLRLYSGWGQQLTTYREISAAGAGLAQLTGAGDFDRDGTPDLLAVDTATGDLVRYPIRAAGLGAPVTVAKGMTGLSVL